MASVAKRGSKYCVRYRYINERGEKVEKRVGGFATKEDAMAAARDLESKSSAGIDVHGDLVACGAIMERWFAEHCINLSPGTISKSSDAIDRLKRTFVYDMPVRKLTPTIFLSLLSALQAGEGGTRPISLVTARTITTPMRLALSWAQQMRLIQVNPLARVKIPAPPKRKQRILNDQDISDLLSATITKSADGLTEASPFRVPLLLALYGGFRREEIAALRWSNVDFKRRTITVSEALARTSRGKEVLKDTKNHSSCRTIVMPRFVIDELAAVTKPSPFVAVSSTGQPYRLMSYAQAVGRLVDRVNASRAGSKIPPMPHINFHDLRHTHAAMLIRMNVQPKVISERLGHSSIRITMDLYGYLMSGLQESVADALDADYAAGAAAAVATDDKNAKCDVS